MEVLQMRKIAIMVLVLGGLLFGCLRLPAAASPLAAQNNEGVRVRFVHAVPGVGAVDVYVDGARVLAGLEQGTASPHLHFPIGAAEVHIRPTGADPSSAALASRRANFATTSAGFGHVALVFQLDGFEQATLSTVEDLLAPTRLDGARLHVIHAVPGAAPVDIVTDQGAGFLSGAAFNSPVATVDPPTGAFALQIRNSEGGEMLGLIPAANLRHGFLYTVLVAPNGDGTINASLLEAPVLPSPSSSNVQWVHAASAAGPLDVYLDGVLVAPNVQPGDVLVHSPYEVGAYVLSVRNAGLPASSAAAFEGSLAFSGETITLMLTGSFAEGTFAIEALEDFAFSLTPGESRVRVYNGSTNGPLTLDLDGSTSLANVLEPGENAPQIQVEPGRYDVNALVDDAQAGGPLFIEAGGVSFAGGGLVSLVVTTDADGDVVLTIATSYLVSRADSIPSFTAAPPPSPTPTATLTATQTPLPPTPTPTDIIGTPPPPASQALMIADVNVNEGTNLQCREYPSSTARSIGLIPAGTRLVIVGYGAPLDPNLELNVPLDPANFNGVEAASEWERVWVQSQFFAADGTLSRCWVRADFLLVYYFDGSQLNYIAQPSGFFGFAAIDPPIIAPVPANAAGAVLGVGVANPPQVILPTPTATLTPSATASATLPPTLTATPDTRIRASITTPTALLERADFNATVLREIPSASLVVLVGRNLDGSLLNVRYEVLGEGSFSGWVRASDVEIATPGASIADLPVTQ